VNTITCGHKWLRIMSIRELGVNGVGTSVWLNRADIGLYNLNIQTPSPWYTLSLPYKNNPVHAVRENNCCEKQMWSLLSVKGGGDGVLLCLRGLVAFRR
jgi:hypothetical protein